MPKIFTSQTFSPEERESRKDFIDKHTPYIFCDGIPQKGVPLFVRVRVGSEHAHIDDFNHYISTITLFDADHMLAKVELAACIVSADEHRGNAEVAFSIVPNKDVYHFNAQCYCTKHGLWQSEDVEVRVNEKN
ncbi:desulfoferrodoxin family protein [Sulfurospirillum sp.]|uniref:desulfoferrodoxin family protein n=1 Tax=Sulfurospirillum sp. TaxID=2053622 RepID=UPI002FDEF0DD